VEGLLVGVVGSVVGFDAFGPAGAGFAFPGQRQ